MANYKRPYRVADKKSCLKGYPCQQGAKMAWCARQGEGTLLVLPNALLREHLGNFPLQADQIY